MGERKSKPSNMFASRLEAFAARIRGEGYNAEETSDRTKFLTPITGRPGNRR